MIELNGIYKLKKIKGFTDSDTTNYKVIALLKNDIVICENKEGEHYCFKKDFLIDPDYPEIIYSNVEILEYSQLCLNDTKTLVRVDVSDYTSD